MLLALELTSVDVCDTPASASAPDGARWHEASLPFEAHTHLVDRGEIAHPYRDAHADELGWVKERTWWVCARFDAGASTVAAGPAVLLIDELDTVGTVWLNGVELGSHANVFRPAEFEISLKAGANELLVRIDPPLARLEAPTYSVETARRVAAAMGRAPREDGHGMFGDLRMLRRRKPIVDWGWDFAPRLASVGLGRITLHPGIGPRIHDVGFRTVSIDGESGIAHAIATVWSTAAAATPVEATLTAPDGRTFVARAETDAAGRADLALTIPDARLWWTTDLGEQPLYELSAIIGEGDAPPARRRVGIRTVELDRSADEEGGRHFRFVVNGVPIFARGACLVPSDMLRRSPHRDRDLVELAASAGMNMLRVWGGGGYGSDALYDAADEAGVLIWQDFAFACGDYPEDGGLPDEIAREAQFQTRRLGAHASLALLCGNNEVHAMHQAARGDLDAGPWGHLYFTDILPAAIAENTPGVAYWPGSPYGENDPAGVNGVHDGDRHAWEVWHGLPLGAPSPETYTSFGEAAHFRRYRYDTGRFISEFGIIAAPSADTLAHWVDPAQLRLDSPALLTHVRDEPKEKTFGILAIETGLPSDAAQYVGFTQAVQAEGLKYGVEHYRRHEPHTAGTLIWQLNDPWPGISWSLIDYDLRQKAAYHVVRRAFAPVAASFRLDDDGVLELWVANSTPDEKRLILDARVETIGGERRHEASVTATLAPHQAVPVWSLPAGSVELTPGVVARVTERAGVVPANRLYFGPLREIPFPEPAFTTDMRLRADGSVAVSISAETALYAVRVTSAESGARFDDNVFDLAPGEVATVVVTGVDDPASIRVESMLPRGAAPTSIPVR